MYSKRKKSAGRILTGVLALSMMAFSGCGSQQAGGPGGQGAAGGGKIAVICKAKNVQFWDYVKKGAEDAGEELGYEIVYDAASRDSDVVGQMSLIRNAVDSGVKAIVIAPNDANALEATLKSASSKGIKVITINSDIDDPNHNYRSSYIGSSNVSAGAVAGRQAAQILGSDGGEIAIVGNTEGQQTTVERIAGFKDTINSLAESSIKAAVAAAQEQAAAAAQEQAAAGDESDENPAAAAMLQAAATPDLEALNPFKFVAEEYCDNNRETAKQKALEMIAAHPDLKMMYGVNENSTLGICDAIAEKGLQDKIEVIGFNSNDQEIEYLRSNVLDGLVVQNPYNMGYLGVRYCDKLLDNENISESIDTGITFVNRENLETDIVQLLLHPDKE